MQYPERRTLEELVAAYQLEPEIRDVYVEGETDELLLLWFLNEKGLSRVGVYEIACVDVPASSALQRGLEDNNRGRVIALAHELEHILGKELKVITCVADKDFDFFFGKKYHCELLLLTDYSCMEMYFFNTKSLDKLLKLAMGGFPKSAGIVISEIRGAVEELFAIRMANTVMGLGLTPISFEKCCELRDDGVAFYVDKYLYRYLNANARLAEMNRYREQVYECRKRFGEEARFQVNGHDFVTLLAWYIRQHRGFKAISLKLVERALLSCIEAAQLAEGQLFRKLLARLEAS